MTYKRKDKTFKENLVLTEVLAKELHRFYRAAFKALSSGSHDHGWSGCHKKAYFFKRAKKILKGRTT